MSNIRTFADLRRQDTDPLNFAITKKVSFALLFIIFGTFCATSINPVYYQKVANFTIIFREMITVFMHSSINHLILNMVSIYSLAQIERLIGSKKYFYTILYFIGMNAAIVEFINRFYTVPFAVGFSGVIFGILTLYPQDNILGYKINPKYFVIAMLAIVQIMFERAHLIGHLAGILSGYLYITARDFNDLEH
jgi:membrane associated rhomboid family serine protease